MGEGREIPNRPSDNSTFVPINAGHLNFNAFIIAFNILATAPGFVTKFFKLPGVKKLFAAPANPPPALAALAPPAALNACASAATANNSGAIFFVILSGSCVMSFWRKLGSFSYCLLRVPWLLSRRCVRSS